MSEESSDGPADRAQRIPVIDAEYTRCAGEAPLPAGEYVIEGRRLIVASMPRERAIVDRDPGDEDEDGSRWVTR